MNKLGWGFAFFDASLPVPAISTTFQTPSRGFLGGVCAASTVEKVINVIKAFSVRDIFHLLRF